MAAASVLYQGGEGWHGAMASSQGNLPLKQTALPASALLACAFLVPFSPPRKVLAGSIVRLCSRLRSRLAGSSLCVPLSAAAMCSAGLLQQAWLPAKIPHAAFPCMLLQGAMEQKPGRLLPEILLSSPRLPVVSQK